MIKNLYKYFILNIHKDGNFELKNIQIFFFTVLQKIKKIHDNVRITSYFHFAYKNIS